MTILGPWGSSDILLAFGADDVGSNPTGPASPFRRDFGFLLTSEVDSPKDDDCLFLGVSSFELSLLPGLAPPERPPQ